MVVEVSPPPYIEYEPFLAPESAGALGLILVGQAAFAIEKQLPSVGRGRLNIVLRQPFLPNIDTEELTRQLHLLFSLVLLRDFDLTVRFEVMTSPATEASLARRNAVCLFSGGVDSLCGILRANSQFGSVRAMFCSHRDQSKIHGIVKQLATKLLAPSSIDLMVMRVPEIGKGRFSQLRGFLYFTSGLAVSWLSGSKNFVVSEVGPTMYQPRFGPLDQVTLTSHPYIVQASVAIAALFFRGAKMRLPFENKTKAEVMAQCPRPDLIPLTHSCITQRFGRHDGTCYGCIMRRLAALASGVVDVIYDRDPLADETARDDNLIGLLDYCLNVQQGYKTVPLFRRENIDMFHKWDLFRRYSLDVYGALWILLERGVVLTPRVREFYDRSRETVGEEAFRERVEVLRAGRHGLEPAASARTAK